MLKQRVLEGVMFDQCRCSFETEEKFICKLGALEKFGYIAKCKCCGRLKFMIDRK